MNTVTTFLAALDDLDLAGAIKDSLIWDKTGRLEGQAVPQLASRMGDSVGLGAAWPLDEMPKLLYQEAARRFVTANNNHMNRVTDGGIPECPDRGDC